MSLAFCTVTDMRCTDPPHEAPGWYDLYDTDYTMEVIEKYVIYVKTLIGHGVGYVLPDCVVLRYPQRSSQQKVTTTKPHWASTEPWPRQSREA